MAGSIPIPIPIPIPVPVPVPVPVQFNSIQFQFQFQFNCSTELIMDNQGPIEIFPKLSNQRLRQD
jgi:hypothetical protein